MPHSEFVIRLKEVTVDIPLYGLRKEITQKHPKIFTGMNGVIYLRVLDGISLNISFGERIGLVGKNGSGKTTLLRLIAGLIPPSSGKIEVNDNLTSLIKNGAGIFSSLTGRQNAILQFNLLSIYKMTLQEYINDVEEFSELGAFFDMPVSTYSAGMKGRLQFSMATAKTHGILLMDEWIGVADRSFQNKAHDRIFNFVNNSDTLILASHNKKLIKQFTDKSIIIDEGKIKDH